MLQYLSSCASVFCTLAQALTFTAMILFTNWEKESEKVTQHTGKVYTCMYTIIMYNVCDHSNKLTCIATLSVAHVYMYERKWNTSVRQLPSMYILRFTGYQECD